MSDRPVIYSGQGFSQRGDKDRYVLPASFRKAVAQSNAAASSPDPKSVVLVSKHTQWNCLIGFGESRREGLLGEIDREHEIAMAAGRPFDRDMRYFQLFDCAEVAFDTSGRFVIPKHLRELVGITGGIYFHGTGRFFTLWAPDVMAAQDGPEWASAKAACAALASGGTK